MASGGGLLDLVARGKKDTFFTQNPKISFIHSVYQKTGPSTQEIRYTHPSNRPMWGQWLEFDIEHVGDIMRSPVLLIDLPTWLPIEQALQNPTAITYDISGTQFGYCQDVGALMIEKVQVFAGQYLLQEFWGQWLEWRAQMDKKATVYGSVAGRTNKLLCKSATPKQLRVYLPLLGCQTEGDKGFPTIALSGQNFKIRVFLRKLEEIIEASDGRLKPEPWSKLFYQKTSATDPPKEFRTLPRALIPGPIITLETTQVYIPRDAQELLKKSVIHVPFTQVQFNQSTIEDSKWSPVINANTTVQLSIKLDFVGAVSRIMVGVQTVASINSGQLYNLNPPPGGSDQFLQTLRLNAGLQDRIKEWPVILLRDTANYYKNQRAPSDPNGNPFNVYTLTFGSNDDTKPIGTFNMSRSDTQVLFTTLALIGNDSRSNSRKAYVLVFAEAWNLFTIKNGNGSLAFAD